MISSEEAERRRIETETIIDAIIAPTFAVDDQYRVLRLNRAALQASHKTAFSQAIGGRCFELFYNRSSVCPYCPRSPESYDGTLIQSEFREKIIHHSDEGSEKTFRLLFQSRQTGRIQIVETREDITVQMEKQEEMMRIENLAALGTMVSGIAHELNNPLTGMGLNLQNLEANLQTMDMPEITRRLGILRKDLHRSARIVADIQSFSRPGSLRTARADLLQTIQRAKANALRLYPVLSNRVTWSISGEENVIMNIDSEKIERLFINLFRNSLQALDYAPGSISVDIRKSARWAHVIVEDDAGGIPIETLSKIFNPFYTNARNGQGSGLGLTISHSIVKEHHGRIRVKSLAGRTRFTISLPMRPVEDER